MKKPFFTLALATTLMAGTIFIGCQSSDAKLKSAQSDVKESQEELDKAKKNADEQARRNAEAEEWKIFKKESEIKILQNEVRIAELREKMKNSGKTLDDLRAKRIDNLETQNRALKTKIINYEKSQSDWEIFKREFNQDMDALGNSFNDLSDDNKK